jgi:hypothetical protein
MIGNLTGGTDSISRDIGTVIYRMKMLGFNAIRLPFTFAALAEVCAACLSDFHLCCGSCDALKPLLFPSWPCSVRI